MSAALPSSSLQERELLAAARGGDETAYRPTVLPGLTLRGAQIEEITGFVSPEMFARFDLPAELPAER